MGRKEGGKIGRVTVQEEEKKKEEVEEVLFPRG